MQHWRHGWNAHALATALAAKASRFKAWNARRTCWFALVMSATAGIITRNAVTDAVADALLLGTHRMGRSALLVVHPVGGARHRGLAALCHPRRSLGSLDRQACRLPCQARMALAPGCLACRAGSGLGRRRHPMQVATNSLAARLMRFTMSPANAHVSFLVSSTHRAMERTDLHTGRQLVLRRLHDRGLVARLQEATGRVHVPPPPEFCSGVHPRCSTCPCSRPRIYLL